MKACVNNGAASLGELTRQATYVLREAGIAQAAREARRLIGALADVRPEDFIAAPDRILDDTHRQRVVAGLRQRAGGMPLGRIVGEREFYGRRFRLGPSILEPRLDSEVVVDAALEVVRGEGWSDQSIRIVDVGTGSGCLLISLLAELPAASGLAIDLDRDALAIAAANAAQHGVGDRVEFHHGDALSGIDGPFDLVISNPPYIRSSDIDGLDADVRDYDPHLALDGGEDGLEIYRCIARDVLRVAPNGWMVFEVGAGAASAVCDEFDRVCGRSPPPDWRMWHDFIGHIRCVASKTLNV